MKDELGGQIMKEHVGLRAKIYSYLIYDGSEEKESKVTKKCFIKKNLNLKIIKTAQEHLNLKIKNNFRKNQIDVNSLREGHKNS